MTDCQWADGWVSAKLVRSSIHQWKSLMVEGWVGWFGGRANRTSGSWVNGRQSSQQFGESVVHSKGER